jgi:hypothetical protein
VGKCTAGQDTDGNMAMRIRATNTDSEYVILILAIIVARKRLNVTYTYVACFVHHRDVFWANRRVIY